MSQFEGGYNKKPENKPDGVGRRLVLGLIGLSVLAFWIGMANKENVVMVTGLLAAGVGVGMIATAVGWYFKDN